MIYKAQPETTLKLMYGTAFRDPNVYERYYSGIGYIVNPDLKSEKIKTTELAIEHLFREDIRSSISLFSYKIDNLVSLTTYPSGNLGFINNSVEARGLELEAERVWADDSPLKGSMTWQLARSSETGEWLSNSPRRLAKTINGIGERAGNAALEEVVMAIATRRDRLGLHTGVDTRKITRTSRLVSAHTGMSVAPNKAVVGANAFAHVSGIHQDGVLKSRETYEIMRAQDVGWMANRMVLGKHSGRNAFRTRMSELGVEFASDEQANAAFSSFKDLADKKHEIYDEDLQALVTDANLVAENEHVKLVALKVCSETGKTPQAELTLWVDGVEKVASAAGGGPVDASFRAIESVIQSGTQLLRYSVSNITTGTDAQGEVNWGAARVGCPQIRPQAQRLLCDIARPRRAFL